MGKAAVGRRRGPSKPKKPIRGGKDLSEASSKVQKSVKEEEEEVKFIDEGYEYDEALPEEETKKNRRFDEVDVYEYELPEDFDVSRLL